MEKVKYINTEAQNYETDYANLVGAVLQYGKTREGRNGATRSIFGCVLQVDTQVYGHFPLLTCRQMYPKGILGELAAFFKGPKSLADFESEGCNYWSQWANEDGSIDVDYGNSWIDFNGINQLKNLVEGLKKDPTGRRHVVSGWRPERLDELSLPCCHMLYQWYVDTSTNRLDMIWYQRSVDVMVGLPSDVVLAAAWNALVANEVGLQPGSITMMLGDTHIYEGHVEQTSKYLERVHSSARINPPSYGITAAATMSNFKASDIKIGDYTAMPPIKFEVYA